MRDYVITVNSTVDVPKLWLEERHVPVVALNIRLTEKPIQIWKD